MQQKQEEVIQHLPAIRWVPLMAFMAGALFCFCVAYSQSPASLGYLLTAVLAGVLSIVGGAYLLRRKSEWGLMVILIPVLTHSMFGEDYYPYRSTGFIHQFVVFAQWLSVTTMTVTVILLGVALLQQHHKSKRIDIT